MKDDLARAIVEFVKDSVSNMPVAIPAVVEAYHPERQTADIRLLLSRKLRNGDYDDPTKYVLPEIPVQQFAADDDCFLYLPVEKDTTGILLTMDCDLWAWVIGNSEGTRRTFSDRTHDLSDSVFMPGIRRNTAAVRPTSLNDLDAEFKNGSMRVTLHPDGKIEIKGASAEVIAVLSDAIGKTISNFDALYADAHGGFAAHASAAAWAGGLKAAFTATKAQLDTMKV